MATIDVYKDWLGIPEGDRPPDNYALLRLVQFEDEADRIRANYKKLNAHVRKYATGKYATESQDLLNELAKAMLCLTDPERKRDYDESLGREFEEDVDPLGRKPMEKSLVEKKLVTRDQAREATAYAEARGLTMRDAVVQMELVDQETAAQAYAVELGLPYVDLEDMLPEDATLDAVPRHVVKRNSVLPLFEDGGVLLLACVDLPTHELEEELRLRFGCPVRPVLATPRAIQQAIAKYYAPGARSESDDAAPKGKKRKTKAEPKAKKTSPRSAPQEQSQATGNETMLGIIFSCWGLMIPMLLENYVLFPSIGWPLFFGFVGPLTIVVGPATIAFCYFAFFSKK